MRKTLFLEYKNQDHFDLHDLLRTGVTHVMMAAHHTKVVRCAELERAGLIVEPVVTLAADVCPLHPHTWSDLRRDMNKARSVPTVNPRIIWFDHLRFSGHWEASLVSPPDLHEGCRHCEGRNRLTAIAELARKIKRWMAGCGSIGCFTVPVPREHADTLRQLGQNVVTLGNIFDYVSPMIYHRSLGWSVAQTRFYLEWLAKRRMTAEVLPILQVKDFPDEAPDNLTEAEMATLHAAVRSLDLPTAWFSWDAAIEQGKTEVLAQIWGA